MPKSSVHRVDPASGQLVGVLQFDDPIDGLSSVVHTQVASYGHPLQLLCIADAITAVNRDYPYDGTGVATAGGANTITLSGVAIGAEDYIGLLIVITSGTGIGQVRRISSFNSGTLVATVDRNWTTNPVNGSTYTLLLETFRLNQIHLKTEFSDSAASTNAVISMQLFDCIGLAGQTARAPRRLCDPSVTLNNQAFSLNPTKTSYYHGETYTIISRGALGAKVRLNSLTTGSLCLWAGAS